MKKGLWLGLLLLVAGGCADKNKKGEVLDTPTTGTISIYADESLRPLVEAEVEGFEGLYPYAHFKTTYTSEQAAIDAMLKDSARIAIVTRKLHPEEKHKLDSALIQGAQVTFAKEGIALIMNRENPDSLLRWDQFADILQGKSKTWKELFPGSRLGDIQVVFDHPNSGIIRYLSDTLKLQSLPSYCFAVNSNEAVIDHIKKTKNAIGLIGGSWISDNDDPKANRFLSTIKVVSLSNGEDYVKPYKAYILMKSYPLSRKVIILSREARAGLGSGFIAYAVSDKGQRIVMKAGLVPANAPVRIVELRQAPMQKIVKN